jgi:hypothetical protein
MCECKCARSHVHFVGFSGDEYYRAARVWGMPDFVHAWHDARMYGDVGPNDVIVFGPKAHPNEVSPWTWQDHANW